MSGRFPACAFVLGLALASTPSSRGGHAQLGEQNARLLAELRQVHRLSEQQVRRVDAIFRASGFIGQGEASISRHPVSEEACRARRDEGALRSERERFERICGGPHMAPLYDPSRQPAEQARACIDQFEFPDIPCAYPVVWVRAREAALICEAVGKRLCDAHEWEGACAGRLKPPDYEFGLAAGRAPEAALSAMARRHNQARARDKSWSYGAAYRTGVCATSSHKSPGCDGGGFTRCGSNTFPAGSFAGCRSPLGVYDQNGNAAEHMNLPLAESQMASRGSREYGYTEMKGSWFVFDDYRAHEDWCRWRAPFWHGSRVMDPLSHHNYHLGFRCCKSLGG